MMKINPPELLLPEQYLHWLCSLVELNNHNGATYFALAGILHRKAFYWTVANDDNRGSDGSNLRMRFLEEAGLSPTAYPDLNLGVCTVLEMLIALCDRCETTMMYNPNKGERISRWFWTIMENLGLDRYSDLEIDLAASDEINHKIEVALDRSYDKKGRGGFFPLKNSKKDQREVEIWYQMCAFISENQENFE